LTGSMPALTSKVTAWLGVRSAAVGAAAAALIGFSAAVSPAAAQTAEAIDRSALRVCADPNNLPFSNEKGEGFENKIAELLAAELGVPVRYTWYPDSVGFIRNTLSAYKCDLIIGTVSGNDLLQNTNPYYRSIYCLVHRQGDKAAPVSLDDPVLQTASIGIIAGTPPVTILAQKGLLAHIRSYPLVVDTRFDSPARKLVDDVAGGEVDVGIVWGPIAGYFAKQNSPQLVVVPLPMEGTRIRLDSRITMGMRPNEPEWKRTINDLIRKKQKEIDQILLSYGVPLLDEKGQPITH
jgi:quinoprotein dehydrogenase-associated probable ABC transporter substrate-binding protein